MNARRKLQIIGAIVLLFSMLPLPYGGYTIVRLIMTIISGYLGYNYYIRRKKELAITLFIVAVLFQPFVMFSLGRSVWLVLDIFIAMFFLLLAVRNK